MKGLETMQIKKLLTDTHIGRRFKVNVPIKRLGEREAIHFDAFTDAILNPETTEVVHLGDLFDCPNVSNEVVMETYSVIARAAEENKDTTYRFIRGNHDASRSGKPTSFDILAEMLKDKENIVFIRGIEPERFDDAVYFPFHYEIDTYTQAQIVDLDGVTEIFGHFPDNPVPLVLKEFAETGIAIASGHIHNKNPQESDGVLFVNALMPLNRAEETEKMKIYSFFDGLDDLIDVDVTNRCVVVRLKEGEEIPDEQPDCLSIVYLDPKDRIEALDVDDDVYDPVGIDVFSIMKHYAQKYDLNETETETVLNELKEEMGEIR